LIKRGIVIATRSDVVRLALALLAYGLAFMAVHQLAQIWATSRFYSIWFPAAGVRFAALWLMGARLAPFLALTELAGLALLGVVGESRIAEPLMVGSIISPCLAYGLAVAIAKRFRFRSSTLKPSTLRFGVAAALAPPLGFAASVPWHIVGHEPGFGESLPGLFANGAIFIVGDLLGILLVTPPLLVLFDLIRERRWPEIAPVRQWVGTAALLVLAVAVVLGIDFAGFGIRLLPIILAVGAVGVMYGRVPAWVAVFATSAWVLWLTSDPRAAGTDMGLHLQLAAVVVMGFVAGAYAEDQRRMAEELRTRDSALLHAERLKTLRAMSVAVIHELSQPLSTLSIETKYLAKLSKGSDSDNEELRTVSELIAQKTENLADMLRRLRSFGAAPGQEPTVVEIEKLVRDVVAIIAPEARAAGVRIEMRLKKDLAVLGQDVELQQALTNLLRNAIVASPGGTVRLVAEANAGSVRIDVINTPSPDLAYRKGMGVGKLIVEAIAEMHGGTLYEDQFESGERMTSLFLPAAGRARIS
jgi:signal transduction histidine kinase